MVNAWFREAVISLFSVTTATHRQAACELWVETDLLEKPVLPIGIA